MRVRGIASSILLEFGAGAPSLVTPGSNGVVQVSNIRTGDLWPGGQRLSRAHPPVGDGDGTSVQPAPPPQRRSPAHEEGRSVRTARGIRADPDGAAHARLPLALDHGGEGLRAAEGHHRALPRRGADELPAAEGQDRVRRRDRRRPDRGRHDPQARPHGLDRRRQGVRAAGRRGLPDPHRRVRRGDAPGASRAPPRPSRSPRAPMAGAQPIEPAGRPARRAAAGRPPRDAGRGAGRRRPRARGSARRRRGRRRGRDRRAAARRRGGLARCAGRIWPRCGATSATVPATGPRRSRRACSPRSRSYPATRRSGAS